MSAWMMSINRSTSALRIERKRRTCSLAHGAGRVCTRLRRLQDQTDIGRYSLIRHARRRAARVDESLRGAGLNLPMPKGRGFAQAAPDAALAASSAAG
jgi:hypothetical protein